MYVAALRGTTEGEIEGGFFPKQHGAFNVA